MSNLPALRDKLETVRGMLTKAAPEIAKALPNSMSTQRLARIAMTTFQRNPKLLECDARTLVGAVIQASQLGLDIDSQLGHAYLVPYKNSVQLVIGYKGLLELVRRSGMVKTIYAQAVYNGDVFEYEFGLHPVLRHKPSGNFNAAELTHAYAVCLFKYGGEQFEVMTRAEIEAIKTRSRAKSAGPWETDPAEMWKKTVVRRLCKMLPLSAENQRAIANDDGMVIDAAQEHDPVTGEVAITRDEPSGGGLDMIVETESEVVT